MHVLILPSWYPYSKRPISGIFFRDQALALAKAGNQVGVVAPILKSIKEFHTIRDIQFRKVYWENGSGVATLREELWSLPKLQKFNKKRWLACGKKLVDEYIAMNGRPDIVHAHSMLYAGSLAAEIKQKYKIPFVVTEHSTAFARGMIQDWQLPDIREVIQAASARLAVSRELVLLLEGLFGVDGRRWLYLPNIVDVEFFKPDQADSRENSSEPFIFFSAAFLTYKKGMHFLIEAFINRYRGSAVELWIGGEGDARAQLEHMASKAGKQIRFLGKLDRAQMRTMMQKCSAFVLPSLYETFGVVLIEALATGKPVIATKCGGPESIVHENNGFLVAVGDAVALGDAMQRMLEAHEKFDSYSIRADCIARFGCQSVIKDLELHYRYALDDIDLT